MRMIKRFAPWAIGGFLLGLLLAIATAPDAYAAPAVDIPGVDLCDPEAPIPQPPDSDLPGVFLEQPRDVVPSYGSKDVDSGALLRTSGVAGMRPIVYDMGCGADPSKVDDRMAAWADSQFGGWFITWGQTFTTATDAVEDRVWSPTWISTLLGNLADATVGQIEARVLLPLLGLGLLLCTVMLTNRMRSGDTAGVAHASAWAVLVVLIASLVILRPTATSEGVQQGAGSIVAALHGGNTDPGTAATESVMEDVHYYGWLRRSFGTEESDTARRHGPAILSATRFTWDEWNRTNPALARDDGDRERRLETREELIEAKAKTFKDTAAIIEKEDPDAYRWLTGRHGSMGVAMYEWGFSLAANGFRLMAALLVVLCLLLLTILGLVWLLAAPWLVTPYGEGMGRGLLDSTARCIGFAAVGALGSWLFTVLAGAIMTPGSSSWWSFALLALLTFSFWSIIRPDRKIVNLLSAGRVRGNGTWTRKAIGRMMIYTGVAYGTKKAHEKAHHADDWVRKAPGAFARGVRDEMREDPAAREARLAYVYGAAPSSPEHRPPPTDLTDVRFGELFAPKTEVYERTPSDSSTHPTPPPAGTTGEVDVDVYTRPERQRSES